jgi:hypothetical protein
MSRCSFCFPGHLEAGDENWELGFERDTRGAHLNIPTLIPRADWKSREFQGVLIRESEDTSPCRLSPTHMELIVGNRQQEKMLIDGCSELVVGLMRYRLAAAF